MGTFAVIAEHPTNLCPTSNAQTRQLLKEGASQFPQLAEQLGVDIGTLRIFGPDHIVPHGFIAEHLTGADADPARLAAVLVTLEQALGPIEPRTGYRTVAAQHPQIGSDQGSDLRRGRLATLSHVQPMRHLARASVASTSPSPRSAHASPA